MHTSYTNENDIRSHVSLLKNFYGELTAYALICIVAVLIWVLQGFGYFWPQWVIVIWGVSLLLKGSKLGVIDRSIYEFFHGLRDRLPFIQKGWEEEKVKELMESSGLKKSSGTGTGHTTTQKGTPSKPVQKAQSAAKHVAASVNKAAEKVETKVSSRLAKKATSKPASNKPASKSAAKPGMKAGAKPASKGNNTKGASKPKKK